MKITKDFLKDIKSASAIVIRFDGKFSTIDLFFKSDGVESKRTVYEYGDSGKIRGCWYVALYPDMNYAENTIFSLLKAGDKIQFNIRKNGHESLINAGFTVHDLMLNVTRFKKNGDFSKNMAFQFDSQTSDKKMNISEF